MKFESLRDRKTHLSFVLQLILTIGLGLIYFLGNREMIILTSFVVLSLTFILLVLPIYLFNYYKLEEDRLIIRAGLFKNEILYKSIKSVKEGFEVDKKGKRVEKVLVKTKNDGDFYFNVKDRKDFIKAINQIIVKD